ncbi:site-2 protease family protein [Candidatus Daviesbacteria bacterium]|nr:site-2 protease family protein [Candidatus Daviesbacteria bacterium]
MFILVFLITILILVLIHEAGHFIAAKKFNIKVLEFGFGLPPRAWGKKIGETIYSLNWLPFGGFVRLLGEDEVDKEILDNKRSFAHQSVSKKIIVVVAGVAMNLVLAWVLFYIVLAAQNFKVQLPPLVPHKFVGVHQSEEKMVLIRDIAVGSPAEQASLKKGDRILEFNGQPLTDSNSFVVKTKENAGKEVTLKVSDIGGSEQRVVTVVPRKDPPPGQGAIGISLISTGIINLEYKEPWQKALAGPIHGYNLIVYSGKFLGKAIAVSLEKRDFSPVSQNVAGPIGITSIVRQLLEVKNPLIPYLDFMAALSLNLALVNILPFPGLDGGRLFFLIIEAFTKKRTHPTLEKYIHTIGLAILLGLIFLVTLSDIEKLF